MFMAESKNRCKKNPARAKKEVLLSKKFYGALKSKNEIYFQMASLFKEVTRDEKKMKTQWMEHILSSNPSDKYGKFFINNI
jgi:hypothetical protein